MISVVLAWRLFLDEEVKEVKSPFCVVVVVLLSLSLAGIRTFVSMESTRVLVLAHFPLAS